MSMLTHLCLQVGGYLGYVGYFCFAAGVSLACHVQVRTTLAIALSDFYAYRVQHLHDI